MADEETFDPGEEDAPEIDEYAGAERAARADVDATSDEYHQDDDSQDDQADDDGGESDQPKRGWVPSGRLREESERRRQAEESFSKAQETWNQRLAALTERLAPPKQEEAQTPTGPKGPDQWPNPDEDPIGFMQAQREYLVHREEQQRQERLQSDSQRQRQQQIAQLDDTYRARAAEFIKEKPDAAEAYNFFTRNRHEELEAFGIKDATHRERMIINEERQLASQAMRAGVNPMEAIYNIAAKRGFKPADADDEAETSFDKAKRGAQAARSAGAAGGGAGQRTPSAERMLKMNDEDFNAAIASGDFRRAMGG